MDGMNFFMVRNEDGDTVLHLAIINKIHSLAMELIGQMPPEMLDGKNKLGQTYAHLAVITQQPKILRRLMVGGCSVTSIDGVGDTPLHTAVRRGYVDCVQALLEPVRYMDTRGNSFNIPYQLIPQDLSTRNFDGMTALHLATECHQFQIIQRLLKVDHSGAVNVVEGKAGQTILHRACINGNEPLVKKLIKMKECNINAKTFAGYTPFDFARSRDSYKIMFILSDAGAKQADELIDYREDDLVHRMNVL